MTGNDPAGPGGTVVWRCASALAVLVLAVLVLAPSAFAASAPQPSEEATVYVPIEDAVIERAAAKPAPPKKKPAAAPARAVQLVSTTFDTAATVPFVQIPGTAVPLWWLLLVLLAVPLARWWRSWAARMFV